MAAIKSPNPALLLLAAFSERQDALDWARGTAAAAFGPLALESDAFPFTDTAYYAPTMGGPLIKRFFAFERLIDPSALAEIKRQTNDWERQYAELRTQTPRSAAGDARLGHEPPPQAPSPQSLSHGVSRPLNLDPGYIELAKLVLASTKDHAHRIYLGQGIYAEVTLQYRLKIGWQPQPWTFPDYRRPEYHAFFDRCRQYLYTRLKADGR